VNAADSVDAITGSTILPVAIDLTVLDNRPGYLFHLQRNEKIWVDGTTGAVRKELPANYIRNIASQSVATSAPISDARLITKYDTYYYAHPYREMPLPAWRVEFADADHSAIYLDPVSGKPIGFVNSESRIYRWLRDGLHSFDFPGVNDKRPLWDLVLIPLMLGGSIAAFTGVWLLVRRVRRMV